MIEWLKKWFSRPSVRAGYDAARPDQINQEHWAAADIYSSIAANSPHVRDELRRKSRYEAHNNSYMRGMLDTLANYTVGKGGNVHLVPQLSATNATAALEVEQLFREWAYATDLWGKLHTMQLAIDTDGEAFARLVNAQGSLDNPVELDFVLYECDWFDLPYSMSMGDDAINEAGIQLDRTGNPLAYAMLNSHPGSAVGYTTYDGFTWIRASEIIHAFRKTRPGQLRGIPKTTPALQMGALVRRYTLATVTAAESAANVSAIMTGDGAFANQDAVEYDQWETHPMPRGTVLYGPLDARVEQIKAEQPTTTYVDTIKAFQRECARPLSLPAVLALGDASDYNYASGRLDLQQFNRALSVDRETVLEKMILDRLFREWYDEAAILPGYLPSNFVLSDYTLTWRWPQAGHVDRQKEAAGQTQELANMTTTLTDEWNAKGMSFADAARRRAAEKQLLAELELTEEEMTDESGADAASDDPAGVDG